MGRRRGKGLFGARGFVLPNPEIGQRGLVEGAKGRTRSCRVVAAPCIALPPVTLILVLGAGEEFRDGVREPKRTLGRSEIRCPDAEGGSLVDGVEVAGAALGNWRASGWSERAKVFARVGSGRGRLLPLIYSSSSFFWYAPTVFP